jgi:hypothetical protein
MIPGPDGDNLYTPRQLMIGGGLVKENGKPNATLYHQWLYRKIFRATEEADGPGTVSGYAYEDIVRVALVVRLRDFYIPLKKAAAAANDIVDLLNGLLLTVDGDWPEVFISPVDRGFRVEMDCPERPDRDAIRLTIDTVRCNVNGRLEEMRE